QEAHDETRGGSIAAIPTNVHQRRAAATWQLSGNCTFIQQIHSCADGTIVTVLLSEGEPMSIRCEALPLTPLLHAYLQPRLTAVAGLHQLRGRGPRFAAVLSATTRFLASDFLDRAGEGELRDEVLRFYQAVVSLPLHTETVQRRAGFLRHALGHLLRGGGSLPARLDACLSPGGSYHVAGLGPAFWSAAAQALCPGRHPGWPPSPLAAGPRLGLVRLPAGAGPAEV